jgi:hypothetical protein
MVASHHLYHAGESNQLLALCRGEAWEKGEEVEENHEEFFNRQAPLRRHNLIWPFINTAEVVAVVLVRH